MARGKSQTRYGGSLPNRESQEDKENRLLNLQERTREKLGLPTTWELITPYSIQTAPTQATKRDPRARKIGYNAAEGKLVVRFWDGTWWEYNDISVDVWQGLKASPSTGKYLHTEGLNKHPKMGPFDPDQMPEEVRVLFNQN